MSDEAITSKKVPGDVVTENENLPAFMTEISLFSKGEIPSKFVQNMTGISSFEFLLKHCEKHNLRRNIAVIDWEVFKALVKNKDGTVSNAEKLMREEKSPASFVTLQEITDAILKHKLKVKNTFIGYAKEDGIDIIYIFESTLN